MQTEHSPNTMRLARLDRREVVADFGSGAITSDAGALLLGATDRAIGLLSGELRHRMLCLATAKLMGARRLDAQTLLRDRGELEFGERDEWQLQHRYMQVEAMAELDAPPAENPALISPTEAA